MRVDLSNSIHERHRQTDIHGYGNTE